MLPFGLKANWSSILSVGIAGCGDCGRGVGNNSVQCTSCQKWVHRNTHTQSFYCCPGICPGPPG